MHTYPHSTRPSNAIFCGGPRRPRGRGHMYTLIIKKAVACLDWRGGSALCTGGTQRRRRAGARFVLQRWGGVGLPIRYRKMSLNNAQHPCKRPNWERGRYAARRLHYNKRKGAFSFGGAQLGVVGRLADKPWVGGFSGIRRAAPRRHLGPFPYP